MRPQAANGNATTDHVATMTIDFLTGPSSLQDCAAMIPVAIASGRLTRSVRRLTFLLMIAPLSRITSKSQTVIPKAVREKLGLKPGDVLRYRFEGARVVIERASAEADDDPFAIFTEWSGEADEKAYSALK